MTQGSSLPPLKKNDSKYVLIALLFLLAAGGLWFFAKPEDSPPEAPVTETPPEPPAREQFVPQLEIPEDQSAVKEQTEPEEEPSTKPSGWTPPAERDCRGILQAAQIRDVINGPPRKQVQACYEHGLKNDNLLQGTMKVRLTIGTDGEVRAVSIEGSLRDPQVYACVRHAAKTWKFPKPEGGCVLTEVPFQLTPKL